MRLAARIEFTEQEHQKLLKLRRSRKTAVRLVERLDIILLAHEGKTNQVIAEQLGISENKVGRWRNRYCEGGLKALEKDRPRGKNHAGKSTLGQIRLRNKVIRMTTQEKPSQATHWTSRTLAEELNTTHTFVHRVWKSVGLKPHLFNTFKVSNDPQFEEKLHDVVGLYLSPPENAAVFCVDEKSSIQALDRTQPGLPLKKGRAQTMTHDYKRHGTSTLFAALEVQTGQVIGQCKKQHRHQEFLDFLKEVNKQTPQDKTLHIIVDNYATHEHEKVKNWLKRNKRVSLHFIPTSSSWLNLVERFFGIITEKQIRRGVFSSVKELEEKIMAFINAHNENPKPFVWTKTAEEILEKVGRARDCLNNLQTV
ncbi:MAG: IS630 family transposase [gamma proteobacterium endosymbiont of Lamellibrachia anaximandri]|nr:IS630 family transposase [gamma proteobacterium endosymbiont of Lamellibrachia anaximandri]